MEGKFNSDYSINIVPCTVLTFGGVCHVLWSKLNGLFGATLLLNLTGKHRNGVLSQLVQATLPSVPSSPPPHHLQLLPVLLTLQPPALSRLQNCKV